VRPAVGPRATQGYESALEDFGRDLLPTLCRLEEAAGDPWRLEAHAGELRALQYALHLAAERVPELPLAAGAEEAHRELKAALAIAREETADVAAAVEELGSDGAATLVWEWRVAVFGVRIALQNLDAGGIASVLEPRQRRAYLSILLLAAGVAAVLGGALAGLWPLWASGLALVISSALASHRRP
jgi:hypothetical protein